MNELPPLRAVRDIRLFVLRETDSLQRMHVVQAVIHGCLDELAEATVPLRVARVVRFVRALVDYRELGPFTAVAAGAACVAFGFAAGVRAWRWSSRWWRSRWRRSRWRRKQVMEQQVMCKCTRMP